MNHIFQGNALAILKTLDSESVDCCITSPPYWGLRDYGHPLQIGLEKTPEEYVEKLVEVFREVKRVLKTDGTLWVNLGDSYNGSGGEHKNDKGQSGLCKNRDKIGFVPGRKIISLKPKDLVGIPWRVAFALQADGWWLRQDIIWAKPNPMPESVTDRCTKAHEYVFLLSKSAKYYYDQEAIKIKGACNKWGKYTNPKYGDTKNLSGKMQSAKDLTKDEYLEKYQEINLRSVWIINTKPCPEAHFATFPEKLIEPMIKAGCPEGGIVLDPFIGSGTTMKVANRLRRECIGIDLSYEDIQAKRIKNIQVELPL